MRKHAPGHQLHSSSADQVRGLAMHSKKARPSKNIFLKFIYYFFKQKDALNSIGCHSPVKVSIIIIR